jgi:hypothetical protein
MANHRETRLRRLEAHLTPVQPCPVCRGRPWRVVRVDRDTDAVVDESMPVDGCPACGVPIYRETILEEDPQADLRLMPKGP